MKDSKEEKQMRYLYEKADHLHDKCKISTNTIFLLYTIAASFVIGFAVMTVGALATGHPLGESLMLIMVGALYISAGLGFFGGVLYLMQALIRENTIKEYEIPLWEVREEIPVPPFCMPLSSALFCSSRAPFAKLYPCKYIGKRGCFFPIRIV